MTTDDPTTPPPLPGAGDSRLDSFLQKAAPIIAVERGINARSRVLLEALARDSKLPDDLFDQAIHMLQGAPPVANKSNNRWIEAFCKYLERKIKNIPQGILTSDIEARVISKGVRKFALTEEQARDAVRETATELGLRRISQTEAERHVEGLIQQKVGDAEWLDDASVNRLRKAGQEWGLTPDQVDAIIRKFTHVNRQKQEKEHRTTMVFLTAAGAVIAILLCVFVGVVLFGTGPKQDPEVAVNPDDPDEKTVEVRPRTVKPVTPPKWWDDGIALAVGRVKGYLASDEARTALNLDPDDHSLFDRFRDMHGNMVSPDDAVRGDAYEQLAKLCREDLKDLDIRQLSLVRLDQVFTACYALDPSDEAADRLRDSFLSMAKVPEGQIPKTLAEFQRGFWAVRVAIAALGYEGLPDARADALEVALGRTVGAAVNRRAERDTLFRQCYTGLAKSFYNNLIAEAGKQPGLIGARHEELWRYIAVNIDDKHLPRKELHRLNANVLGVILPIPGSAWQRFKQNRFIEMCVHSGDPINVLKIVESLERTDDRALQAYLIELLIRLDGVLPKSLSIQDVAHAVRDTLGVTSVATTSTAKDRWKMLQTQVDKTLASRPTSVRDHGLALKNTVQLAYLATLACAVTQQELGFPIFDQLMSEGTPSLANKNKTAAGDKPFSDPSRDSEPLIIPNVAQRNRLRETITKLENFPDFSKAERLSHLRALKNVTRIPEISPRDGAVIAKYVFAPKEDSSEQNNIIEILQDSDVFPRWKYFRLAMADEVAATSFSQAKVETLLSALFKHKVELDAATSWKQSAYDHLLRSVLDDLKAPGVSTSSNGDELFDVSADALHSLYKTRARLLGLAPAQYETTTSSAQALRLLVDRSASKLGAGSNKTPDDRFLAGLAHELRAIEYLGNNDLRQTVLLQRIWLRLLSIDINRRQPGQGHEAAQCVDKLRRDDAKATDLVIQLVNGESATLKLWMLHAP